MLVVAYESVDLCSARAPRGLTYSRGMEAVGVRVRGGECEIKCHKSPRAGAVFCD